MVDIRTTIEIGINDLVEGIIRQEPQWSSDSNTRLAKGIARQVVECCHKVTHEYKFTAVCVLSKKTEVISNNNKINIIQTFFSRRCRFIAKFQISEKWCECQCTVR